MNSLPAKKPDGNAYIGNGHEKIIQAKATMNNACPEAQTDEYGGDREESPPSCRQSHPVVFHGRELRRQLASE